MRAKRALAVIPQLFSKSSARHPHGFNSSISQSGSFRRGAPYPTIITSSAFSASARTMNDPLKGSGNNEGSSLSQETTHPPPMSPWNGLLRFSLEIAALTGIGHFGYQFGSVVGALTCPVIAATAWGVFNVPNDPSRSGAAPIPVAGWQRLMVEGCVLGWGGYNLGVWNPIAGSVYGVGVMIHYASYSKRIQWLLQQR